MDRTLSPDDVAAVRGLPDAEATIAFHHGLGTWIRNEWGLWAGGPLQAWFLVRGYDHPDGMSAALLEGYWAHLHGAPYPFHEPYGAEWETSRREEHRLTERWLLSQTACDVAVRVAQGDTLDARAFLSAVALLRVTEFESDCSRPGIDVDSSGAHLLELASVAAETDVHVAFGLLTLGATDTTAPLFGVEWDRAVPGLLDRSPAVFAQAYMALGPEEQEELSSLLRSDALSGQLARVREAGMTRAAADIERRVNEWERGYCEAYPNQAGCPP